MWYLADAAAIFGDETACFIADISLCKRSVIDAQVLSVTVGESKTAAGTVEHTARPSVSRYASPAPISIQTGKALAEMQGLFC